VALTLDDLRMLNAELAASIRAGLPLPSALRDLARQFPRRSEGIITNVRAGLESGLPLSQAVRAADPGLPDLWIAILEVGERTGRPAESLEHSITLVDRLNDGRRRLTLALLYPIIVFVTGWGVLAILMLLILPGLLEAFRSMRIRAPIPIAWLDPVIQYAPVWLWVGPALAVCLLLTMLLLRRTAWLFGLPMRLASLPLPGLFRSIEGQRRAAVLELVRSLTGAGIDLPTALRLASRMGRDTLPVPRGLERVAERVERGETVQELLARPEPGVEPALSRAIAAAARDGGLERLPLLAETLRFDADCRILRLQLVVPFVLMTVVAATALGTGLVAMVMPMRALAGAVEGQ
jgi:type II secretory pathway component PulF